MLKKCKLPAFQLVEAIFSLGVIALILSIGLPVYSKTTLNNQDAKKVQNILMWEQKEAFLTSSRIQVSLSEKQLRVHKKNYSYTLMLMSTCTSNFQKEIEITENGTWERGGSIYCGQESVVIGIGQSIPRIKKTV